MRKPIVAGNWKMYLNRASGTALASELSKALSADSSRDAVEVVVCPPFVYLDAIKGVTANHAISVGAQNLYHEREGAFTGEVSAGMLVDIGVRYVILGHSERRHTIGHHEDDRMIQLKTRAALAAGLTPILCVGETLAERNANQTPDVLTFQLTAGVSGVQCSDPEQLVIAYEPVWAIGTGQNATPAQAQEAHVHIRSELRRLLGSAADGVRILYGGSVKPDNAAAIFSQPDVDGGLIGGASLKAASFLPIVDAALAAGR